MNKIVKIIFIFLFTISIGVPSTFGQIPDNLILSFKSGNTKVLSGYFNQNVELVIGENDNVYSKAQAQQIVSKFFREVQPEEFSVIHTGGEKSKYVIGNLQTQKGMYRVYFLLKQANNKPSIHQLRIEKQE